MKSADKEGIALNLSYGQYEAVRDEDIMSVSESSEDDKTPRPRSREENRREIDPLDVTVLTKATRLSWSNLLTNGRATARNIARMRATAKPVSSGLKLGNDIRRRQTIAAISKSITSSKSNRTPEAPSTPLQQQTGVPVTEPPLKLYRTIPEVTDGETVPSSVPRHLPDVPIVSISKPEPQPLIPSDDATISDHESIANHGLSVDLRPVVQVVESAENGPIFEKETVKPTENFQTKHVVNQIEPSDREGINDKHISLIEQTQSTDQTVSLIESSTAVLRNPDDQVQASYIAGSLDDDVVLLENYSDAFLQGQARYGGLTTSVSNPWFLHYANLLVVILSPAL